MPNYMYILIPLGILALLVALVFALRSRVDLARQVSDTVASIFTDLRAWLRSVTLYDLRQAMSNGVKAVKQSAQSGNYRYERPWYLMIGEEASGKTTLLRSMIDSTEGEDNHAANWGIFPNGAVIDIAGQYFLPPAQKHQKITTSNRAWRKVLRRLQAYRERRPLDGVILAVNIHQVIASANADEQSKETIRQVRAKLHLMTKRLGMRIPVYVVFTHCDQLPNIVSFYNSLPQQQQREIFGWSSPYALDVAYEPAWTDNAFEHVLERIALMQYDVINNVDKESSEKRDNIYDLYSSMKNLAEPVKHWADMLFGSNGHESDLMLRGMYFTGHQTEEIQTAPKEQESQAFLSPFDFQVTEQEKPQSQIVQTGMFCASLLERKIFREQGVATPLRKHHVRRSYFSIATHVLFSLLIIAGVATLIFTWKDLKLRTAIISKMVNSVRDERKTSLYEMEKMRKPYYYADKTKQYLGYFADLEKNKLFSYAVPASWVGILHRDIRGTIANGLKEVVIAGMKEEFSRRADDISDAYLDYRSADTLLMNRYTINTTPEYTAIQNFVQETGDFEQHVNLYNTLSAPHSDQRLSRIISYLYGKNIEPDVQQLIESDYQLMKSVEVDKIFVDAFRPQFTTKAMDLDEHLVTKLFFGNPVVVSVNHFRHSFNNVSTSRNVDTLYNAFLEMAKQLEILNTALANKETGWMSEDNFEFDANGVKLLKGIESSRLLGSGVSSAIRKNFDSAFVLMRTNLVHAMIGMHDGLEDSSSVLKLHPETSHFMMSDGIDATYKALAEWRKQPFVVKDNGTDAIATLDGTNTDEQHIVWNSEVLKTLPSALDSYTKYLADGINKFPHELQIPAETVVRRGIHNTVNDIVARAAYKPYATASKTEQDVAVEVQAFQDAAPNLALALRQLSTSDDNSGVYLARILSRQVAGVLRSMNGWLSRLEPQPYSSRLSEGEILRWKPTQSILSAAFNISEADELQEYLEKQRKPLETWSKQYASPLISFYNQNGLNSTARNAVGDEEQVRLWSNIIRALDGYVAKTPGNSVRKLEDFMSSLGGIYMKDIEEMQKIAITSRTTSRNSALREDYFLKKINEIATEIKHGITDNSNLRFDQNYDSIRKATNAVEQLFPFGNGSLDAEPDKVRAYYDRISNELDFAKLYIAMGGNISREQELFLRRLYASKEFFKPVILAGENNNGAYNVTMTFRTNQRDEQNANSVYARVISQTQSGGEFVKTLITPGDQAQFQWRPGDEFRFEMVWAKDGGVVPLSGVGNYEITAERTAAFRKSGTWSLLRFFAENRSDKANNKLQLELRVVTGAKNGGGAANPNTIVYVDVEITPRSKEDALTLPILAP